MAQRVKTDWILFGAVAFLLAFGLLMLMSASSVAAYQRFGSSTHYFFRQFIWALAGVPAMMFLKRRDYRFLNSPAWVFGLMSFVLLLVLAAYLADPYAQRRIFIGSVSIQPSEFAKPVLILFLAYFVTRRAPAINNRYTLIPAGMLVGLLAGAVMASDLGTGLVLVVTAAVIFFVAGLERRFIWAAALIVVLGVTAAIIAKPYRIVRIFGLFDPEYRLLQRFDRDGKLMAYIKRSASSGDPDYHLRQSLIAVGSGGPFGLGLMQSRQKLLYLPEAHTDFIYAVVSEELGLAGSLAVVAAFLVLLWRGLRLYFLVPDDFGRYLALGVTAMIVSQAFINIGVVLGLLPTKGIPLPMISYGGSSLVSTLASLGILQSIGEHSG